MTPEQQQQVGIQAMINSIAEAKDESIGAATAAATAKVAEVAFQAGAAAARAEMQIQAFTQQVAERDALIEAHKTDSEKKPRRKKKAKDG